MPFCLAASLVFIACDAGPANHFAAFTEELKNRGYAITLCASGPALEIFNKEKIEVHFSFDTQNDLDKVVKICESTDVVISDIGHAFDIELHKTLSNLEVPHFAYYDNTEPFVPGQFSVHATKVSKWLEGMLFANSNLADEGIYNNEGIKINLTDKKLIPIGFYPLNHANSIAYRRTREREALRKQILNLHGIKDIGQKIYVYFGGNNEVYFNEAFPAFLSILDQTHLGDAVVMIQQHPSAVQSNHEKSLIEKFKQKQVILSRISADQAQVVADAVFYYQTSLGPQFVLAGIPTVQIGHAVYGDILVKNGFVKTATQAEELQAILNHLNSPLEFNENNLLAKLGIQKNWLERLERAVNDLAIIPVEK